MLQNTTKITGVIFICIALFQKNISAADETNEAAPVLSGNISASIETNKAAPVNMNTPGNTGMSLLTTRSMSFGHFLHPHITMINVPQMAKGTTSMDIQTDWGNIWNYKEDTYLIDYEQISIAARFAYALKDNLTAGFWLPFSIRQGGAGDNYIEFIHKTFNIRNAHREEFRQDKMYIDIKNDDDYHSVWTDNSWGINDIPLFVSYMLTPGNDHVPAVTTHLCVTLPVGDESKLEGTGKPFYSTGLILSKQIGETKNIVHCGARLSHCPADSIAGLTTYKTGIDSVIGCERKIGTKRALILQYAVNSPIFRERDEMSLSVHEFSAGIKQRINDTTVMEFSATENLFKFNNSADVGLHLGIKKLF